MATATAAFSTSMSSIADAWERASARSNISSETVSVPRMSSDVNTTASRTALPPSPRGSLGLGDNTDSSGDPTEAPQNKPRERDPVFWTELELRRLSNLVAACIHSGGYVGSTPDAREERRKMRVWIDAMKRKAMRILHRAESLSSSSDLGAGGGTFSAFGGSALVSSVQWPGIDPSITDPVALGDEYVRLVQDYYAVLGAEEERASEEVGKAEEALLPYVDASNSKNGDPDHPISDDEGSGSHIDNKIVQDDKDDWEIEDDVAFKRAVQQDQSDDGNEISNTDSSDARTKLLGNGLLADGVRRRKGTEEIKASSQEQPESEGDALTSTEQSVHDDLTANLVDLVGHLKQSVTANQKKIDDDRQVVDDTEEAVDKNLSSIGAQSKRLQRFSQYSASSTLWIYAGIVFIVLAFIIVLLLLF